MQYKSLLNLSLLLVSVSATPTPAHLAPRACQTKLADTYQQIFQNEPQQSGVQGNIFDVSQAAGGVDDVDTLVSFTNIPAGSFGCQLAIEFPDDYPIGISGASQVNVYALPNNISPEDTYSTFFPGNRGQGIPEDSFLFGTATINGGSAVINSEVCAPNLNFLVAIASESAEGFVEFVDEKSAAAGISGFYLTYDC